MENVCPALDFGWTVADSVLLELGGRDVGAAEAFFGVRTSWAVRLTDGRIVVQERRARELRYFSPAGEHVGSVGGWGYGPGEFQDLWESVFALPGDSIGVYDITLRRFTIFDAAGGLAATTAIRLSTQSASIFPIGRHEGVLVVDAIADPGSVATEEGVAPLVHSVWRVDASGEEAESVIDDSSELHYVRPGGSYRLPFDDTPFVGMWRQELVVGDRGAFTFRAYDLDGTLGRIVRRRFTPRPVLSSEIEARHTAEVARLRRVYMDATVPRFDRMFERPEIPKTHSVFDAVIVDRSGNLWVGLNEAEPGPGGTWARTGISRTWSVFDPEGVWMTDVRMPEGLWVTDIGEDYVLGVATLELDVPVVRLYALSK